MKGGSLGAQMDRFRNKIVGHVLYTCIITMILASHAILALEIAFWFDLNSYLSKLLWNVTALRFTMTILAYQEPVPETSIRIIEDVENVNFFPQNTRNILINPKTGFVQKNPNESSMQFGSNGFDSGNSFGGVSGNGSGASFNFSVNVPRTSPP
ncbi:24261_t:CDS:2, partial [Entrophospora sp. SA101]